jgi:hypothetical protein
MPTFASFVASGDFLIRPFGSGGAPALRRGDDTAANQVDPRLIADPNCVTTRGSSYENRANLAPAFFDSSARQPCLITAKVGTFHKTHFAPKPVMRLSPPPRRRLSCSPLVHGQEGFLNIMEPPVCAGSLAALSGSTSALGKR